MIDKSKEISIMPNSIEKETLTGCLFLDNVREIYDFPNMQPYFQLVCEIYISKSDVSSSAHFRHF
jgi:hypothetical protein